jgi:hypothetical protein
MRLLRLIILLATIGAAAALPATALSASGHPKLKFSPSTVKQKNGAATVTATGKNWGASGCSKTITLTAKDASGNQTALSSVTLKKKTSSFSKRITVSLAPGQYTVSAGQVCTNEEEPDSTVTVKATLTIT